MKAHCASIAYGDGLMLFLGWSKEELLQEWLKDSEKVCVEAGVDLPQGGGLDMFAGGVGPEQQENEVKEEMEKECGICCMLIHQRVLVPCEHHFCRDCWKGYVPFKNEVLQ